MKKILVIILFLFFSIYLPGCVKDIKKSHTEGLVFELIDGKDAYAVTDYTGDASEVYIDSHYNSLPVTTIGRDAFLSMSHVTSIELPDTIEELGWGCFMGTSISKEITVPDKVYYFGGSYDYDAVLHVSENHMYHKEIVVDGVNTIVTKDEKELIFVNRRHVDEISQAKTYHVPTSITKIGNCAMFNANFTKIIVPDHVTEIDDGAFYNSNCEVNIPTQVTRIGDRAYAECKFKGQLILPEGLEVIDNWAFSQNEITEIVFPSTLKTLKYGPFGSAYSNVTKITFKSWRLDEDSKSLFFYFIYLNYLSSPIEEITVVLPEDEAEAEELRECLEKSLKSANDISTPSWIQKSIVYE